MTFNRDHKIERSFFNTKIDEAPKGRNIKGKRTAGNWRNEIEDKERNQFHKLLFIEFLAKYMRVRFIRY